MSGKFLRSKVARRIFALFVACALVPMAVFTTLSFIQVSRQLRSQNHRQLQQGAKSLGIGIYERLTILEADLEVASLRVQRGDSATLPPDKAHFQKITAWQNQAGPEGNSIQPMAAPERAQLASGKALIRMDACSMDPSANCIVIERMIDSDHPGSGLVVGEVDAAYLWSADRLPADLDLFVLDDQNKILYSSTSDSTAARAIPSQRNASGFFEWRSQGILYDAAYRDLFLRAEFLTGTWTVVVRQEHQAAFAPMQHFRDTLLLVAILALWIVVLFSLIQIRRTMGPLEKLGEGTKQIAEQNFDARVEIASGDEFEKLAASFNSMSCQLGRQFHTLRVINEIDQAILSSLNREAVVSTALSRLANLLPGECFALVLFQPDSDSTFVQLTVRVPGSEVHRTLADRIVLPSELKQFEHDRSLQISLKQDSAPDFLLPLKDLGVASVLLFPILLDQKPFAALVCGESATTPMTAEDIRHAVQVADQLAVAFSNVQLMEAMEQLHWGTLTALARAIDAKSTWTAGHSERVTEIAMRIGKGMGLSERDLQIMQRGGLLHDVGKIGIAPGILDKPGKLDPDEVQQMRDHVRIGVRILEPIKAFAEALSIVAQHHEWFNGGGYPEGLAGEQISLHARIFAVADCYDALVSDRPYRRGLPKKQVVKMLTEKSGTQFDPKVIDVFVRLCAEDETMAAREEDGRLVEQTV